MYCIKDMCNFKYLITDMYAAPQWSQNHTDAKVMSKSDAIKTRNWLNNTGYEAMVNHW